MSTAGAPLTQDELRRAFESVRRPDDPDLPTLLQHAARYSVVLGTALRARRASNAPQPAPDALIPAPVHWPDHIARQHPLRTTLDPAAVPPHFAEVPAGDGFPPELLAEVRP